MKKSHGFTLVEMLLCVGFFALFIAFMIPVYFLFKDRNQQIVGLRESVKIDEGTATYKVVGDPIPLGSGTNLEALSVQLLTKDEEQRVVIVLAPMGAFKDGDSVRLGTIRFQMISGGDAQGVEFVVGPVPK